MPAFDGKSALRNLEKWTGEQVVARYVLERLLPTGVAPPPRVPFIDIEDELASRLADPASIYLFRTILSRPKEGEGVADGQVAQLTDKLLRTPLRITCGQLGRRQPSQTLKLLMGLCRLADGGDSLLDWRRARIEDGVAVPTGAADPLMRGIADAVAEWNRHSAPGDGDDVPPFTLIVPARDGAVPPAGTILPAKISVMGAINLSPWPRRAPGKAELQELWSTLYKGFEAMTDRLRDWARLVDAPLDQDARPESVEMVRRAARLRTLANGYANQASRADPDEKDYRQAWETVRRGAMRRIPVKGFAADHPDKFFRSGLWRLVAALPAIGKAPMAAAEQRTQDDLPDRPYKPAEIGDAIALLNWVQAFRRCHNDPAMEPELQHLAWELATLLPEQADPLHPAVPRYFSLQQFLDSALGALTRDPSPALEKLLLEQSGKAANSLISLPSSGENVALTALRAAGRLRELVEILEKARRLPFHDLELWIEAWALRTGAKPETAPAIPKFQSFDAFQGSEFGVLCLRRPLLPPPSQTNPAEEDPATSDIKKRIKEQSKALTANGVPEDRAKWIASFEIAGIPHNIHSLTDDDAERLRHLIRTDGFKGGLHAVDLWLDHMRRRYAIAPLTEMLS